MGTCINVGNEGFRENGLRLPQDKEGDGEAVKNTFKNWGGCELVSHTIEGKMSVILHVTDVK